MEEQIKINDISEELVVGQEYKLKFYTPQTVAVYAGKNAKEELTFIRKGRAGKDKFFNFDFISPQGFAVEGGEISKLSDEASFGGTYVWKRNILNRYLPNPLFSKIEKMLEEKRFGELAKSH